VKKNILFFVLAFQLLIHAEDRIVENRDAADNTKEQNSSDPAIENKKTWGIAPVAIPYYTPDTTWGAGAQIILYYKTGPESFNKTNELSVYGTYTLLKQVATGLSANIYPVEKIKITGLIEYNKYPAYFWGIGPDTKDEAKENYTSITFLTRESVLYNIFKNLYMGPTVSFFNSDISEKEKNGLLAAHSIAGSDKARSVGAGLNITWDSTDSSFYPHTGLYIDIKETNYFKVTGSSYNYSKWEFDFRYFFQVHNDHVVCFQLMSMLSQGTVPFHNLAELGGNKIMRGYFRGRYQDKNSIAFQTEYRYPLFWRVGATLFGSIGTVAPNIEKFDIKNTKKAAGSGLRFNVDKSQHINMRLDAGVNEDLEINAYFLVKEAF
jgi:outer membrane protein assembly factor BamA